MGYLSREDIEIISEKVIRSYMNLPDIKGTKVFKIDPDKLITGVLKLNLEYHHLSLDRSILGLTSTLNGVKFKIYDDDQNFCILDDKTVLIEKDLQNNKYQTGRCNFTKAHEAGHQIVKLLFPKDYGINKRELHFSLANPPKKEPEDWEEWQANAFASALLMPRDVIGRVLFTFGFNNVIEIINREKAPDEYERFSMAAQIMGVSKTALSIRLDYLGLVKQNDFNIPYTPKSENKISIDIFKMEEK